MDGRLKNSKGNDEQSNGQVEERNGLLRESLQINGLYQNELNRETGMKEARVRGARMERDDRTLFLSAPDIQVAVQEDFPQTDELKREPAYAWLNLVASFAANFILGYHTIAFGLYYVEISRIFESTQASAGAIGALHSFFFSISGLLGSVVIKLYGCRVCGLSGGIILSAGLMLSACAPNMPFLYFSYGAMAGLGASFVSLSSMSIIPLTFNKRRSLAVSISVVGIPAGNLICPLVTPRLIEALGLRGALLINSGILLNSLVCVLLWKQPSCTVSSEHSAKSILKSLLDFSVLRDPLFVWYTVSSVLMRFNTMSFFEQSVSRAVFNGTDFSEASIILTYLCICSLISRTSISVLVKFVDVNPFALCTAVGLAQAFASYGVALTYKYYWTVVFCVVFGLAQGGSIVQALLCIVRLGGANNFARSRAVWNMCISLASLTATPLTGFIFDVTENYSLSFFMSGTVGLVGSISIIVIFIVTSIRDKNKRKLELSGQNIVNDVSKIEDRERFEKRTYTF